MSPLLPVHIVGGILGILSGAAAMSFRKGSPRHALAGKVFVAAMLTMAAAAVYLAFVKQETPNILAGILTFYLVTTALLTARRGDGKTSRVDWAVLLIPLIGGSWMWFTGLQKVFSRTPPKDGVPIGMSFFVGSVMLLSAAGDLRMLVRDGLFGRQRIARHLWRMCFGLFIAAGSFFLGPSNRPLRLLSAVRLGQHLPRVLFSTGFYLVLTILPLVLLIFWLLRVRFSSTYKKTSLEYRTQEGRPVFGEQSLAG